MHRISFYEFFFLILIVLKYNYFQNKGHCFFIVWINSRNSINYPTICVIRGNTKMCTSIFLFIFKIRSTSFKTINNQQENKFREPFWWTLLRVTKLHIIWYYFLIPNMIGNWHSSTNVLEQIKIHSLYASSQLVTL